MPVLFAPAQAQQLGVELLDSHAYASHARLSHRLELRLREELRNALDGDFEVRRSPRQRSPDDSHELAVLLGTVEVGRASAKVDRRRLGLLEPRPVEFALDCEVPKVR